MSEDVLDRLERDLTLPIYRPTREVVAALIAVARAAREMIPDDDGYYPTEAINDLTSALMALDGAGTRTDSVSSSSR